MKAITFLLHTQQPILATSLQGDPNSDVSYDYILGSMIRGALISRYLNLPHNQIKKTDDILDSKRFPDIKRLFFDASKTRYLNAYPVGNDKQRTLPVPLSWYKDKGDEFSEENDTHVYDFSQIPIDEKEEYLPDDFSSKLVNESFCSIDDYDVLIYLVKRRFNIHNQRDRKHGKGTDSSGAVFRYDAIDAGQTFQGVILCDSEEDKTIIESLLKPQDIWFGGSQSAGYGHTVIELISNSKSNNKTSWSETQIDLKTRLKNKEYLTITLLSDTILRNDCGQYTVSPEVLCQIISSYLNLNEELEEECDKKLKLQENGIYSSSLVVGGFNRKWGLPLPQTIAFKAGSVFVCQINQKTDRYLQKLQKLEEQGIGERRIEGFGRIVFNWLDEDITEYEVKLNKPEIEIKNNINPSESLSQDSLKIINDIATRIIRKNLDILLRNKVASIEVSRKFISDSQLSRLMIITRQALSQLEKKESKNKKITELVQPINSLLEKLPSHARSQFERTYLNNDERFDQQIIQWLKLPSHWIDCDWIRDETTKKLVENGQPSVIIANVTKNIDNYLALEYTFRLIIAITKKTIKDKNYD